MHETSLAFAGTLDLAGTVTPLAAGPSDPTTRVTASEIVRATYTPEGPATLHVAVTGPGLLRARAWGEGAGWALDRTRDLLGLDDAAPALPDAPRVVRELAWRAQGVRLARTHRVVELLVPIVLAQLVSGKESERAFRRLVRAFSEPAPGPFAELWLPLSAQRLRAIPLAAFPAAGASERQGATLREVALHARRVEEADDMPAGDAERRLRALPGIGAWTAGMAMLRGMGHADAVPLGDYNLPSVVAWNLAGEPRAGDARMLELLEPCRGQRGRVIRWIQTAGRTPPRRGPRMALRPLDPDAGALLRRSRGSR